MQKKFNGPQGFIILFQKPTTPLDPKSEDTSQHPQAIFSEDQWGNNLHMCTQKPNIFYYTFPTKTLYKFLYFPCVLYTPSTSTWVIFRVKIISWSKLIAECPILIRFYTNMFNSRKDRAIFPFSNLSGMALVPTLTIIRWKHLGLSQVMGTWT